MYQQLKPLLKDLLKKKGLSYKKLGKELGMSEAGIKKLFQAKDCSLHRLQQICEALGADLPTLMIHARDEKASEVIELDPKIQSALLQNPRLRAVYWLLFVEGATPNEILQRYRITQSTLYKCLRDLDRMGIIQWKPGDKVNTFSKRPFLVKSQGPLIHQWIRDFSASMIEDHLNKDSAATPKDGYFSQRLYHLKPESFAELRNRMHDLAEEFSIRSNYEKPLLRNLKEPIRVVFAGLSGSPIKDLS